MAKIKTRKSRSRPERRRDPALAPSTKISSNPFANAPTQAEPKESVESLIATASSLLRDDCAPPAALSAISRALTIDSTSLQAIELAGEIQLELGDVDSARSFFARAVEIDPNGSHEDLGGSGPEKFLWLAQLSENGGAEAVGWYEKGVEVLRAWIHECETTGRKREMLEERELRGKMCSALCGMTEIYMTDLWYGSL